MSAPLGTVAHYELRRRLGSGGMGEVYLAHDTVLERPVAIKFLIGTEAADPDARRRLRREAQAAAALDHPNICSIYEIGTDDAGRDFIAMQYVEGETLAARLQHGPLGVRPALDLVNGIADALDAAHRHGVIHRDLKPQNVMVTPSGAPKLLDFGIAKVQRASSDDANATTTTRLDSGSIAGTPAYMAPEVLQGRAADARSDLFSMGVVLYECLTGSQPFKGVTPHEVWGRVLHAEPDAPSRTNLAVSPDVDSLCQRLLAKEPSARFQSAAEVCGALQVLRTHTGRQPTPPRRRQGVAVAMALGATLLAGGLIAGGRWWTSRTSLPPAPPAAEEWYARGIDAVRQGAYVTARKALEEAVRIHPGYALAHSRLAEVLSALDEERAAQSALIRTSALVPDESGLPDEDRLRLDAIRAMVLRDFDHAIAAYTDLAKARPADAGALVDLGRAQEAAGRVSDARASYERATRLDSQLASGFLRLGAVLGDSGGVADALKAFDEADRLYGLASNEEGRVETLLKRGAMLDTAGRFDETAQAAEEAGRLARQAGLLAQEIRAGFERGSAQVGAGRFSDGEATVRTFVDKAMEAGLQGTAADGLIDMAGTLLVSNRLEEADAALVRATAIATDRSLTRTAMRATTQRASLKLEQDQPREALRLLEEPLRYFAASRYRRLEAVALTVASRAHENLGDYAQAEVLAARVLEFAAASGNKELSAQSQSTLATLAAAMGRFPQSLTYRLGAEENRRALGDTEALPYDLTNRAELLIRLGRGAEAERVLGELDTGIAAKVGAYPTRIRRVALLRALQAAINGRFDDTRRHAALVDGPGPPRPDDVGQLAAALGAFAQTASGAAVNVPAIQPGLDPTSPTGREARLWRATALARAGQPGVAAREADALLSEPNRTGGAEFEFRVAALAAIAWAAQGDAAAAAGRSRQALSTLERLRLDWGRDAARGYEARRDVAESLIALQRLAAGNARG